MKQLGTLALFLTFAVVASATTRSTRAFQSDTLAEGEADGIHGGAFLEVSQNAAVERKVLLGRLSKAEALTGTERQALRAQQQVLLALEQEQEVLGSRLNTLETSERATSGKVIMEKGTVTDSTKQTPIVRQDEKTQSKAKAYEVAHKHRKLNAGSPMAKKESEFVVLLRGPERQFWKEYNKAYWEKMVGISAYLLQIFIVAFLYMQFCKPAVSVKIPESQVRTEEFQFGAFDPNDCARDCQMCVCAGCCPWIRWAENMSKDHIQFLAFLPGLFITALLASAGSVTFGASVPILVLVVVLGRQRIRDAYGLPSGTCHILLGDCLLWICCPCCAIVQEARQVEYVEAPMQEYAMA